LISARRGGASLSPGCSIASSVTKPSPVCGDFAENISVQAGSLERTVMDSAEAVNGADAVLLG